MKRIKLFIIMAILIITILPYISASEKVYTDIKVTDWFYNDIIQLSELNIFDGYEDNSFRPQNHMTFAEFTKCIILAINAELGEPVEDDWAKIYIDSALANNIINQIDIDNNIFVSNEPITRGYMTQMLVLALNLEIARIDTPFIDKSDNYINTAYNEYLLRGMYDENNNLLCNADAYAKRSEIAAIINRTINYIADPYEYKKNAILENASKNVLSNESEIFDLFYIMNKEFITEYTFNSTYTYKELSDMYHVADAMFLECFQANKIQLSYFDDNNIFCLKLVYNNDFDEIVERTTNSIDIAKKVINTIIKENMTEHDKVKAIHDYIVLNCEYDYVDYINKSIPESSYRTYGVFEDKKAVCQGYCSAFNLLCDVAGIKSISTSGTVKDSNELHSWNAVLIDNAIYYLDVTSNDPVPDKIGNVKYTYFMLTEQELESHGYSWNKEYTNIKYFY